MVKHYVKTKNLKAHRVFEIIDLNRFKNTVEVRLTANHCFHYDVFDLCHHLSGVLLFCFFEILQSKLQTPLVTHTVNNSSSIWLKLG